MPASSFDLYRRDLRRSHTLDASTERALARRWASGDRAAGERLVEACLPFVITIAREYRHWGVPFEDLVQQGNIGLLRAAERFDPDREIRLATYAAQWIRGEIREHAVRAHRIVRVGTTQTERVALRSYRGGRAKSAEEMAAASGMPLERARQLFCLLAHRDEALDATPEGAAAARVESMAAEQQSPEDSLAERQEQGAISLAVARALAALGEREKRIVEARLLADEPRTLDELGQEMGVSRERVRQLEARARERLAAALSALRGAA